MSRLREPQAGELSEMLTTASILIFLAVLTQQP